MNNKGTWAPETAPLSNAVHVGIPEESDADWAGLKDAQEQPLVAGRANGRRARVLLVDDDPALLRLLTLRLESAGYDVSTAANGVDALRTATAERPDVVITDLRMDQLDGAGLLDELGRQAPGLPVIVMTAHGSIPEAVELTRLGAFGFLTKPIEREALFTELEGALAVSAHGDDAAHWRENIVTRSPLMEELLTLAKRAANTASGISLIGPGGCGKALLASAIHRASGRTGEFVMLDCSALPTELFESEVFGHAAGAFAGAPEARTGLMQVADGGTLFLKDVTKLSLALQAKLLRAIQTKRIKPIGGSETEELDVRIVAASTVALEDAVRQGEFREDLYYRLSVVQLTVPALAERREDVPLLVNAKLDHLAADGRKRNRFSPQAMEVLSSAPWPGNVRHLFNVVEKTAALASGPVVSTRLVTTALGDHIEAMSSLAEAQDAFTRDYLIRLLRLTEGNVSKAARLAKRNRTDFYRLLSRHDINWGQFKRAASATPA